MSDPSQLRVADADRERLVAELHEHTVAGRLSAEEFEERIGAAYKATTFADLAALRADLPPCASSVQLELSKRKSRLRRRLLQEAGGSLSASAVCVGVWIAAGAHGAFWPAWVILFTGLPFMRDSWRLLGPGSDLETVEARMQARHTRERLAIETHAQARAVRHLSRGWRRGRYRGLPWM
jgi:Domain of unknown function (DUF1707)